jgi:hypothetical protein
VFTMPGLCRVGVLAVIGLVRPASHLSVVAMQLLVVIFAGYVSQSQSLAVLGQLLIGQRAEVAQGARDHVEDVHPEMLTRWGLSDNRPTEPWSPPSERECCGHCGRPNFHPAA